MELRSLYNYDRDAVSEQVAIRCTSEDRTQQQHKEECDINTLVRRFGLGIVTVPGLSIPKYGDFSHISNYHEALNQIAAAREAFEALPADMRDRFTNDPGRFVDFASDPANVPELVKLGFIEPMPPEPSPTVPGASA